MNRSIVFACLLLSGCAVKRAEPRAAPAAPAATPAPAAPATTPAMPPSDATGADAPAPPAVTSEGTTAPTPPPSPMTKAPTTAPGGGSTGVVAPEVQKAQLSFDQSTKAFTAAGADCAQMCKALSSMTNATDRLCSLTKESSEHHRCANARAKLESAKSKVKSTCGDC